MRDTVLDTLHALGALCHTLQARLVQIPHLVEMLLRISRSYNNYNAHGGIPGTVGVGGGVGAASNYGAAPGIQRTEGMIKALQLMGYLLSQVEGSKAFLALQPEFLAAACSDDFIAEVVCNKALPVQQELKARIAYTLQQQQQLEMQFSTDSQQVA
mmetsp:Transcript_7647/g.15477  ORF Transcript_7647/g.15477 Transcript_7647/m.15477 type:complete len:156 (+) Transcript_7647:2-469(+)